MALISNVVGGMPTQPVSSLEQAHSCIISEQSKTRAGADSALHGVVSLSLMRR